MKLLVSLCIILILLPAHTFAHSGRTDNYGGHHKTSNDTYHCHSGQCLEDAKQEAYDQFYPIGQQDGKKRNDRSSELVKKLSNELDPDIAEYMVPYAEQAYQMGYENTYVPTFWEKYRWYIGGGSVVVAWGIYVVITNRKSIIQNKKM